MNVQEIFAALEIPETRDENEIRAAYRRLLTGVNPEDDPEGFKRLRGAYEEALTYAKIPAETQSIQEAEWMEEKGPAGDFLRQLAQVYQSLPRRLDLAEWKRLTEHPVLQSLDEGETAKWGLFTFLEDHFRLPCAVWQRLDEVFLIEENEQELKERLPEEFIDFVLYKIRDKKGESDFPYEAFQGDPEGDYDGFLQKFLAFINEEEDDTDQGLTAVERKLEELYSMDLSHPWLDLEKAKYLYKAGKKEEALQLTRLLLERGWKDDKILLTGARLLQGCGCSHEAEEIYREYLKRETRTNYGSYGANFGLAGIEASKGNWENARNLAMDARELRETEEVHELLTQVNGELISLYTARTQQLTGEEANRLGWCFIHTERGKEGWEFFEANPIYYEDTLECHKMMSVLSLASERPDNGLRESGLWRKGVETELEKEEKGENRDSETVRLKREVAKSHQLEGRCYRELCRRRKAQEEEDAHAEQNRTANAEELSGLALEAFDRALELDPDNIDFMMHRAMLLRDRKEYTEMVAQCERILELDPQQFWACYYMQEAYEALRMAQEVVDAFYRAKEIYAGNGEIYLRAMRVFKAYSQYKDALDIIRQAEEAHGMNHELMVEKIGILDHLTENQEDWQAADDYAGQVIERLKAEGALPELLADAYLKRAYLNDSGDNNNKLKGRNLDLKYALLSLECKDTAAVRYCLGRYYREYGRNPREAYTHLKFCEERGMNYEWMYFYIARCHEDFKEWNEAIEYYKKVMECNPEFDDCYWRLGWLYRSKFYRTLQQPYADKALYYYNLQGEKFGEVADHFRKRATIYLRMKDYEKALEEINEGLSRDKDSGMWLFKGQILRAMNRYDQAIACFEESIKAEDRFGEDDAFCYEKIFQCFLREKRWDEGVSYFKKVLEKAGTDEIRDKCLKSLWKLEADAGHLEEALMWLERLYGSLDLSRRSCDDWEKEAERIEDVLNIWYEFRVSSEEELRQQCEPAASLEKEALKAKKEDPAGCALYYQNMGEAYFYLRDYERGLSFFEQSFRLAEGLENYDYTKSLFKSLMKTWFWLGQPHKAEKYAGMYRKELEKDYEGCEDLGISVEEMMTGPTTESKQVIYNLFCCAYYTGDYEQARRYGEMMESRGMCWWCDEPGCTEAWNIKGLLALLDGKNEEAYDAFEQADRLCWLGGGKEERMIMRHIKEIGKS